MNRYHANPLTPQTTSFTIAAFYKAEQYSYYLGRKLLARYAHFQTSVSWALANPGAARQALRTSLAAHLVSPLNVLILLWIFLLCWGEIWSFDKKINACDWPKWETWPSDASPHHIAFIADPQLVDPHTYPGRPWPLSALTVKHSDLYMRRSYSRIQRKLDPNTIIFLGDLFDGGREWSTPKSQSPEYIYRKYGDEFWLAEFDRFSDIFLREWKTDSTRREARRIIASLPGNHDIGFARGVRKPVRDRFIAYFGDGNRLDIIGNHTFAQVDTASLTAAEQAGAAEYSEIWGPPNQFLESFRVKRATAIANHLSHLHDTPRPNILNSHEVVDMGHPSITEKEPQLGAAGEGIPTVLLTHVPLYRMPGERCGPLRERYPKFPNSLVVAGGYQYQNVVSGQISASIAEKMGGTIEHVFSGDDHDYCELVHHTLANPGQGIREITVKSISEAMGVRRPGFVLSSLWNPIDAEGKRIKPHVVGAAPEIKTLQSHLCLLPDEIGIIIKYAIFTIISAILLLARAVSIVFSPRFSTAPQALLPSFSSSAEKEKTSINGGFSLHRHHSPLPDSPQHLTASTSSSADEASTHLSSRTANPVRPRSAGSLTSHGLGVDAGESTQTWSAKQRGFVAEDGSDASYAYGRRRSQARLRPRGKIGQVVVELLSSIWYVARVAVAWYIILFNWW